MRTTSSIQFYVRKCKQSRKTNLSPLEVSIIISGQRKFLTLPMKFNPDDFNRRNPPQEIIEAVDLWRNRITQYQIDMLREGMVITSESIREVIQQGGVKAFSVGMLFDSYLSILHKRIGVDLKQSVYRKYELVKERVLKFVNYDADVTKLNPALIKEIEVSWRALFDPATLCGYLTRLKSFCTYGMNLGKIQVNPFISTKIRKPHKPIKHLTEQEVMKLYDWVPTSDRLRRTRDLLIIQIATGMSYADVQRFSINDLRREGSFFYIKKERVKTGRPFVAAVFPFGIPIINFYGTAVPQIPISNQKYNKALKELQKEVGLETTLVSHIGRRTYATLMINRGCDMGTVAAALGDNPSVAAQYYAKVYDSTIIRQQIEKM